MMSGDRRLEQIAQLLSRPSPFGNETGQLANGIYEPSEKILNALKKKVLVIGAGGLGCEILKDLALSGFTNIHVIDMDTIDISNLNRQFLFRECDVGNSKAATAANFIMLRIPGVLVTSYVARVQEKDVSFYRQFHIIISGLDNIEARRWINSLLVGMVTKDEEGEIDPESIIPFIDGGTEGLQGQARIVIPKITSCFECTLDLFPPQKAFPMCTIAHTPRIPEHCIAYAYLLEWDKHFPTKKLDKDSPDDMQWVYEKALERAKQYKIEGVTYFKTMGVVKNIIPAVASTNALIAAACVNEAFKLLTFCSQTLNTYMMYMGQEGCYTNTYDNERNPHCIVCSDEVDIQPISISNHLLLKEFIEKLCLDPKYQLKKPSLIGEENNVLYMQGPLEHVFRPNLDKSMSELITNNETVTVTDPTLNEIALSLLVKFIEEDS